MLHWENTGYCVSTGRNNIVGILSKYKLTEFINILLYIFPFDMQNFSSFSIFVKLYLFKSNSGDWLMRSSDYIVSLFRSSRGELFLKTSVPEILNNRKLLEISTKPLKKTSEGVNF